MSTPSSTLLLAALGAGGLVWLYKDREKLQEQRTGTAAVAAPVATIAAASPARRPAVPASRAERIRLAPRTFDPVFREYGRGLPVAYLRALALRESDMNPRAVTGSAVGLLQVVDQVRVDFNKRHGTSYARRDLFDPAVNVAIAADALSRVIDGYARFHPHATHLRADWSNPLFVELLTFGWNAGFSERGGVGKVAQYLEGRGFRDFAIDDVHRAAGAAGASPNLANPAKVRFSKAVATQFLRERARDQADQVEAVSARGPDEAVDAADVSAPAEPVTQPDQVDGATS